MTDKPQDKQTVLWGRVPRCCQSSWWVCFGTSTAFQIIICISLCALQLFSWSDFPEYFRVVWTQDNSNGLTGMYQYFVKVNFGNYQWCSLIGLLIFKLLGAWSDTSLIGLLIPSLLYRLFLQSTRILGDGRFTQIR
jgi:hypothetical protein